MQNNVKQGPFVNVNRTISTKSGKICGKGHAVAEIETPLYITHTETVSNPLQSKGHKDFLTLLEPCPFIFNTT